MTSAALAVFALTAVRAQPVSQPPQILQSPSSCTKRAGTRVTFTVEAEGSPDLAYAWEKDGVPLADDGHFAGTGSSSLVITEAAASDIGAYSVAVSNPFGVAHSLAAALAVEPWHPWQVVGSDPNTDEITRRVFVDGDRAYLANGYVYFEPTPNTGLRIVDVSDPTSPRRVGAWRANYAEASSVVVSGNRAYVTLRTSPPLGLGIVDLSNETSPTTLGLFDTSATVGHGVDAAVSGTVVYASIGGLLLTLEVSDPANITPLASWTNNYTISRVLLSGTTAYVAGSGLQVLDLADPTNPLRLGGVSPANVISVAPNGRSALTVGGDELRTYDVLDPSRIVRRADLTLESPLDLTLQGDLAFVACGSNGVAVVDVSDPIWPARIGQIPTLGQAQSLVASGDLLYVADGSAGLTVLAPQTVPNLAPWVVSLPQGQTVAAGGTAFFSVAANGTASLRYQWYRDGVPLTGETNAILRLTEVQPAQAGQYRAVVTNDHGSAAGGVALLTVMVPPRLDLDWDEGLPQLELTGVRGYAYAIEHAPELPWPGTWFALTNIVLTADHSAFADPGGTLDARRFYRARQLDYAPDHLIGKTIVATVTNTGPFTVTLAYGFSTFAQIEGGDPQEGQYIYTRSGPVTAWISDVVTAPPDLAGETSTVQLRFSTPVQGIFVSNSLESGEPVDTVIGTFELLLGP